MLLTHGAACRKNTKERKHTPHNLEKQISFLLPSLFPARRNPFHFITLWITVKRSQRPSQTRSSYTDFLLQGTSGSSQLSFYALLPFHPDYKLLQGPGAIQLHAPFKSGFKEKAAPSRCKHTGTKGNRITNNDVFFHKANSPFFCFKSTASSSLMLRFKVEPISILNVTPN